MGGRKCAVFGVIGPLAAYFFISVSIALSPWFSWRENALSDLGHAVRSGVAPIFNFGLLLAGFLFAIYSITALRKHAKYTSYCLLVSALALQLVAVFDEVYGFLHYAVSVMLFVSLSFASILYSVEKRSLLALMAFFAGLSSWVLHWTGAYNAGVAVPEAVSSLAVTLWVVSSALKVYLSEQS